MSASLFCHAFWRSSSTYFFSKFRTPALKTLWYYEPFNEILLDIDAERIAEISPQSYATNNHPDMAPYFQEFLPLLRQPHGILNLHPDTPHKNAFPSGALPDVDHTYLATLEEHAAGRGKRAVYGFCRSLGRVGHIRRAFGGRHIFQYRNPHQILDSVYTVGFAPLFLEQFSHFQAGSLPHRLGMSLPVGLGERHFFHSTEYQRFFFEAFVVMFLNAALFSDLVVNINTLAADTKYRERLERTLARELALPVTFEDVRPDQAAGPVFDPSFLERAVERYLGGDARLKRFIRAAEDACGCEARQTARELNEHVRHLVEQCPGSHAPEDVKRALTFHQDLSDRFLSIYGAHVQDPMWGYKHMRQNQPGADGCSVATAELQAEVDFLRAQLQAVHASASWRITAPLRAVKKALRSAG